MTLHDVIVKNDLERLREALVLHTNFQKGKTVTDQGRLVQFYTSSFRGRTVDIYRKDNRFFMILPNKTLEITPIVQ